MKNNEEIKNLALHLAHFVGQMDQEAATWQEKTQAENQALEKKFENSTKKR